MLHVVDRPFTGEARWRQVDGAVFEHCAFDNCLVRRPTDPTARAVVRNVRFSDVSHRSCWVNGALIEDTSLDGLKALSDMPLFLSGCAFGRGALSGSISHIKFNRSLGVGTSVAQQESWDAANAAHYAQLDWALDISKARFTSVIDLGALPGSLIRRDPETQVLVSRVRLEQADWLALDYGATVYGMLLSSFLTDSRYDDVVLVAARGNRKFKEQMVVLTEMRARGLAQ